MQYQELERDWAPDAVKMGLEVTTAKRAQHLALLLRHLILLKTDEFEKNLQESVQYQQAQQPKQTQFALLQSLHILLKFLKHTEKSIILHGPSVAYGFQKGGKEMQWGTTAWSTTGLDGGALLADEMPMFVMDSIKLYLDLHKVIELPGLGGHELNGVHEHTHAHRHTNALQPN